MKLHLPKALLTAVLAACMVNTTAWGDWGNNGPSTSIGDVYYVLESNIKKLDIAADKPNLTTLYIAQAVGGDYPNGNKPASIEELILKAGDTLSVVTHPWKDGSCNFSLLTIDKVTIADGGTATFNVEANQNAKVVGIDGKFSKVDVSGSLAVTSADTIGKMDVITVKSGGILDLTAVDSQVIVNYDDSTAIVDDFALINDKAKYITEANGYIKVAFNHSSSKELKLISNTTQNNNIIAEGALVIHGNGQSNKYTIGEGVSLIANGSSNGLTGLEAINTGYIEITGGSVEASKLTLGHTSSAGNYWGKLTMIDGKLKIGSIEFRHNHSNVFSVTGGELEFTSANVLNHGSNTNATINILGTSADKRVVLKANSCDWTLNALGTNPDSPGVVPTTIGNVTIAAGNKYDITLANVALSGSIVSNADLVLGTGITVGSGVSANLSTGGDGVIVLGGTIQSSGRIELGGTLKIEGTPLDFVDKTSNLTYVLDADNTTATNDNRNGFIIIDSASQYWVVQGTNSTLASENMTIGDAYGNAYKLTADTNGIYLTTNDNTIYKDKYYVSSGGVTVIGTGVENATATGADTYVVQGGTMNIEGTMYGSDIQFTSGYISLVNKNSTLVLDSASNAASLLSRVTTNEGDAGTIKLTTSTTMSGAAQAKGKLIVEEATLTINLGRDTNHTYLTSFSAIDLNDAIIMYHGSNSELKNVTVGSDGATLRIKDMGTGRVVTFSETTTLKGDFTIESAWNNEQTWKYGVNIAALTGSGDLTIKGTTSASSPNAENKVTAKLQDTYTGSITVTHGAGKLTKLTLSADGNINLTGLNIKGGATVDLSGVEGTKNLGTVEIDGSSSLSLTGKLGNMAAIGEGALTLAAGTSTSGTVSIANELTIGGTIDNTGSFTLTNNVTIADIDKLSKDIITYSNNGGLDGYGSNILYYVVKSSGSGSASVAEGKTLNGRYGITSSDGSLVFEVQNATPGGIYYVNTQDFLVDGSAENAAKDATGYKIAEGKTLTISAAQSESMKAGKILSEATGEGNIELNTNASYSDGVASQAKGKLTINGVKLSVGRGTVNDIADGSNISSFSSVDLKGGTLILNGSGSTINSLTVSEGTSTLTVMNQNGGHQDYTLSGITTLNADLDIASPNEHGDVIVKELTGSKNLSIVGGNADWGGIMIRLEKLTDYTGSITVDNEGRAASPRGPKYTNIEFGVDDGDAAFTTLKGLEIKGNAYATVYAKGESTIESLTLNKGTLNYKTNYGGYTYTLDKVEVKGSGTIAINSDDIYYEGEVTIKNLKNAEGETSGELTLSSNFKESKANVFNLEDGDFSGKIVFESLSSVDNGTKQLHALNLKDGAVASKAVINVEDTNNSSHMGIAVGADKVIVKGIAGTAQDVAIYSGVQAFQSESFTSDDTVRTLEIATDGKDENYVSAASIKKNVNLVKSGEGSQTFTGSVASTSVSVLGGGLSLTGIEKLQLQDLVVKSGATLSVGNGVATANASTSAAATSVSRSASLQGGATINGGLDLSAATSLTLDGVGSNAVMINGDLVLRKSGTPLTLRGDVLNSIASLHAGDQLKIFDVKGGGFFVGGTQYSEALTASNGIILDTIFSSEDINLENYYLGFYNIPDEAGYSTVYIGMIVPEPTTATLSLLALAALAARRRRR